MMVAFPKLEKGDNEKREMDSEGEGPYLRCEVGLRELVRLRLVGVEFEGVIHRRDVSPDAVPSSTHRQPEFNISSRCIMSDRPACE